MAKRMPKPARDPKSCPKVLIQRGVAMICAGKKALGNESARLVRFVPDSMAWARLSANGAWG
jgi:hypothetical protein